MWTFWEEVRWGKWRDGAQKRNISETRKGRGKVTMECLYRNSPTLFPMIPSPTPYGLLFPKIGGSQSPPKTSIAIGGAENAGRENDGREIDGPICST